MSADKSIQAKGSAASRDVWVDIYIASYCVGCDYSREVAAQIRRDFPRVTVRLIDIATATEPIPEPVFATPTYLLNGRLWCLGNPSAQEVQARISQALAAAGA